MQFTNNFHMWGGDGAQRKYPSCSEVIQAGGGGDQLYNL